MTVVVAAVIHPPERWVRGTAAATARPSWRAGGQSRRWYLECCRAERWGRSVPVVLAGARAAGTAAAGAAGAATGARAARAGESQLHRRVDELLDLERHALQCGELVLEVGHDA